MNGLPGIPWSRPRYIVAIEFGGMRYVVKVRWRRDWSYPVQSAYGNNYYSSAKKAEKALEQWKAGKAIR